jgi:hypothetical protein
LKRPGILLSGAARDQNLPAFPHSSTDNVRNPASAGGINGECFERAPYSHHHDRVILIINL